MPTIAKSIVVNNPAGFSPEDVTITASMPIKKINCVAYNGKQWIIGGSSTLQHTTLTSYQPVIDLQNSYVSTYIVQVNKDSLQLGENARIRFNYPGLPINTDIAGAQNDQYTSDYNSYLSYLGQAQDLYNTTAAAGTGTLVSQDYYTTHTIAISTDGYTWNRVTQNPFSLGSPNEKTSICNGFAWNGSLWVAIGTGGANNAITITNIVVDAGNYNIVNQIATSPDGINWTPRGIPGRTTNGQPYAVAANSSVFIIVSGNLSGITNTIAYPTSVKIYSPFFDDVPTICVSTDGINWKKIGNSSTYYGSGIYAGFDGVGGLFQGYGIAYNGAYWVAVGAGLPNSSGTYGISFTGNLRSCIVFSTDNGTTWEQGLSNLATNPGAGLETYYHIFSVAWNGSYWLAVGQVSNTNMDIRSSCIPIPISSGTYNPTYYWSGQNAGVVIKSTNSVDWTVSTGFPVFTDIMWDGNYWVATGQVAFAGDTTRPPVGVTKRSRDGVTWETIELSGNAIASNIPLPILGGTINTVSAIIVGYGTPSSVLRTFDNITWRPQLLNGQVGDNTTGNIQKEFFGAIWTGSLWIIVGNSQYGNLGQSIVTSSDGISWSYPTSTLETGKDIAWSGTLAIAVGEGINTLINTSPDGITWTTQTPVGLSSCQCVAWNGSTSNPMWIIGGNGGMNYSSDGITWSQVNTATLTTVNSIAYNSLTWIAVGTGPTHTINMSIDGIHWFDVNPATNPFTVANAIAWSGNLWVAVGSGTNTLATSQDGYNWTDGGANVFTTSGTTVSWTGDKWIASGVGSTSLATSTDGITWSSFDILLVRGNRYVNKTASLPNLTLGAGVASLINSVITGTIVLQTNLKIASDAAAVELAANQAAAAAAAAAALLLRNATKSAAVTSNNTLNFWQTTITTQYTPLTDKSFIDLSTASNSTVFASVTALYNAINAAILTADSYTLFINDDSNSQTDIDSQLVFLQGLVTIVQGYLPTFYNQAATLYTDLLYAEYKTLTQTDNVSTMIQNWGFPSQDVINAYNDASSAYLTTSSAALRFFADTISNTYTYSYTPPDFATTLSNTFSSSIALRVMNASFRITYPFKQQADAYYNKAFADAQNWGNLTGTIVNPTTIVNAFAQYYTDYFYTTIIITPSPLTLALPTKTTVALKYFKVLSDEFAHPGFYPGALATLYASVKSSIDTIDSTKNAAISYAQNIRKTTIQNKLNDIKTITRLVFPNGPQAEAVATIVNGSVTDIIVTKPGNGYYSSSYNATITDGGVSLAYAEASMVGGHVTSITLLNPGSGYTSPPTVTITGGGGSNATATATISPVFNVDTLSFNINSISCITVTNGGSGYTSIPTVTISGGGVSIATATVTVSEGSVTGLTVTNGGSGYTSAPTITIDLPLKIDTLVNTLLTKAFYTDSNYEIATHIALLLKAGNLMYPSLYPLIHAVHLADVDAEADGCSPPVTGWGGTLNGIFVDPIVNLTLTEAGSITAITILDKGTPFISQPTVSFIGGNGAAATAVLGSDGYIASFTVTNSGYGYTSNSYIATSGGRDLSLLGTQGQHGWDYFNNTYYTRNAVANYIRSYGSTYGSTYVENRPIILPTATATISGGNVTNLTLTNGGSGYLYDTITVAFSGGGGAGATATAIVENGVVTSITLTNGGSNYIGSPSIVFIYDSLENAYDTFQNLLTWTDFMEFTNTATYGDILADVQQLNTAINEIESDSLFASGTADTAGSADVNAIQSQYIPFATKYLNSLVSDVSENIPSAQDKSDFGYITFASPINSFTTFNDAVDGIHTDYTALQNMTISSGYTNSQIDTLLSNAEAYRLVIQSTQSNSQYQSIVNGIPAYRNAYSNAQTYTNLLIDRVNRWSNMKGNAISMSPFTIGDSEDGLGRPFIVSIPPSNTIYWLPVKYTLFSNLKTFQIEQCYSNVATGLITALPSFSSVNTEASSVYRGTANYYSMGSFSKSDITTSNINYSAADFTSNGNLFISSTTKDSINVSEWLNSMYVSITDKVPTQATATVQLNSGSVASIFIANPGSNYISPPTVIIGSGGTGDGATATATIGPLMNVSIITNGSGYTSVPTVAFSGGGAIVQAIAVATVANGEVVGVIITDPGYGYTASPTVTFSGGGATIQATAIANVSPGIISKVTVTYSGSGYNSTPLVTFTDGGAQQALATATLNSGSVSNITLLTSGTGYVSPPTVVFTGGGATAQATATASISNGVITNISITNGGTGYTSVPIVSFSGGITTQATGTAAISGGAITGVTVNYPGSGFTISPTVTFSGGGGTGATADVSIASGSVTSVTITNGGTGYTSVPTVTFTGGSSIGFLRIYSISSTLNYTILTIAEGTSVSGGVCLKCQPSTVNGSLPIGNDVYLAFSTNMQDFYSTNYIQNFSTYSSDTKYYAGQCAIYNNLVYTCILDNTDATKQGITGLDPITHPTNWKIRKYPYVLLTGKQIEADPNLIGVLTSDNCQAYSSIQEYNQGDIVLSSNFYFCSYDIGTKGYLVGIDPTNTNYWIQTTYIRGYVDGVLTEINPTNFPALSDSNKINVYSPTATYSRETYVLFNNSYCFLILPTGATITGVAPNVPTPGVTWRYVTYPMAYVDRKDGNGLQYVEITTANFLPLVPSNFAAYSSTKQYKSGSFVNFNNSIYACSYNKTSLSGVDVTNTAYWKRTVYPVVVYNGSFVEAGPGVISALSLPKDGTDFPAYNSVSTTYMIGDTVSITSSYTTSFFECIHDVQMKVPISNIIPTNTTNWVQLNYPVIKLLDSSLPVQADPSVLTFTTLNEQDYHEYNNNWLYRIGDLTSYNGNVYECINTTPPNPPSLLFGVNPATSPSCWEDITGDSDTFATYFTSNGIVDWSAFAGAKSSGSYTVGSLVQWNGDFYRCEVAVRYQPIYFPQNPLDVDALIKTPPNVDTTHWSKVDRSTLNLPLEYNPTTGYNVGSIVTLHLPDPITSLKTFETAERYNQTSYSMNFFRCINVDPTYPVQFKLAEFLMTETVDQYGNLIPNVSPGNWDSYDIPRYGTAVTDPFALFNFPVKLRRSVAMNINFPYETALVHVHQYPTSILTSKYNFANLRVKTATAASDFLTLKTAGTAAVDLFNTIETPCVLVAIILIDGGTGYTSPPTVTIPGGIGATATATVENGSVTAITLVTKGSNYSYTNPPNVVFTGGGGTGAQAIAGVNMDINGVIDLAYLNVKLLLKQFRDEIVYYMKRINIIKTQYFNFTTVQQHIEDNPYLFLNPVGLAGLPATATATVTNGSVSSIQIVSGSSNYTSAPQITITGGGGSNATATAVITNGVVTSINITNGGTGYTSAPTVTFQNSPHILCFLDLGVGNIDEIKNGLNKCKFKYYAPSDIDYYYTNTDIINTYKDEISTRIMYCRDLTGFAVLTQMLNNDLKMNARITCPISGIDTSSLNSVTIETPITEFKGVDNYELYNNFDDRYIGNSYTEGTYTYDDINSLLIEELTEGDTYYINNNPILNGDLSGYSSSQIAKYTSTNYHLYQWQANAASNDPLHVFTHPGWVDLGYYDDPADSMTICALVNCAIKESMRPPEYTIPGSEAQRMALAITYQTNNPTLQGINQVARGLVGIAAAGFQNCWDPTQITGLISLVTGNPLSFIPEITFSNFNDANQNIAILNAQIHQTQAANVVPSYTQTADTLGQALQIIGMLLLLNRDDVETVQELINSIPPSAIPTNEITFPEPLPALRPPNYVPVPPVRTQIVNTAARDALQSLRNEQVSLLNLQSAVQARLNALQGLPTPIANRVPISIPDLVVVYRAPQPNALKPIPSGEFVYNESLNKRLISAFAINHSRVELENFKEKLIDDAKALWYRQFSTQSTVSQPVFDNDMILSDNLDEILKAQAARDAQILQIKAADAATENIRAQIQAEQLALEDVNDELRDLTNLLSQAEVSKAAEDALNSTNAAEFQRAKAAADAAEAENTAAKRAYATASVIYTQQQVGYKREVAAAKIALDNQTAAVIAAQTSVTEAQLIADREVLNTANSRLASAQKALADQQALYDSARGETSIKFWNERVNQARLDVGNALARRTNALANYAKSVENMESELYKLPAIASRIQNAISRINALAGLPYNKTIEFVKTVDQYLLGNSGTNTLAAVRSTIKSIGKSVTSKIIETTAVKTLNVYLTSADSYLLRVAGIAGVSSAVHCGMGIGMEIAGAALTAYSNGAFETSPQIDIS